jgi:cysteine desulfurase family protein
MIYLDNAASTWPKPQEVAEAMSKAVLQYAANPGRGSHALAQRAGQVLQQTRERVAELFHVSNPKQISFFSNATGALNQAIKGLQWEKGDRVVTTSYEHNSVRRPLAYLQSMHGVEVIYIRCDHNGYPDQSAYLNALNERTRLVAITYVSNLTGAILPLKEMAQQAKEKGIPVLVDASQAAGFLPLNLPDLGVDMLATAGHKGLYGPQGTGVLYVAEGLKLTPLWHGGTGSHSERADMPEESPHRYEAGTPNTPGIAGLGAGVSFVLQQGVERIQQHETELTEYALTRLAELKGVELYGPDPGVFRAPVIAFNLHSLAAHELATILDQHYQIAVRAGVHCTPLGHETIATLERGAVRISFGYFNQLDEIDRLIEALREIDSAFAQV